MAPGRRIFFSGDSGYFDGFRKIGEKYGPFDLTLLETGAYNENWAQIHMHPHESAQAHLDLRGRRLLPIHNGTFDLSMHSWHEPFDRIAALGAALGIPVITPRMGEPVGILQTKGIRRWWGEVDRMEQTGQPRIDQEQTAAGQLREGAS
jgi:L-ascorbate metabolism protein UlaG (beta-lactamase superfamily)